MLIGQSVFCGSGHVKEEFEYVCSSLHKKANPFSKLFFEWGRVCEVHTDEKVVLVRNFENVFW
jgi:hypothetical protein